MDSSSEITCHNCGCRSYSEPKYDLSRTTVVEKWVTEEEPGFGSVLVKPRDHIATAVYYLHEATEPNQWVETLKSREQEVQFGRVSRWNGETQTIEEIYRIGEVEEVNQKGPRQQSPEPATQQSWTTSNETSEYRPDEGDLPWED